LTAAWIEAGQSTLSLEGQLFVFGKTWATFPLVSGSEARVGSILAGDGRTLNDDGMMFAAEIPRVWSSERGIVHATTLDQMNRGDHSLARHEMNILT
jgi:hypothetical protein